MADMPMIRIGFRRHIQRVAWNRIHATSWRSFDAQIVFVWSEADQTRHAL